MPKPSVASSLCSYALLDHVPVPAVVVRGDDRLVFWSRAASQLLELPAEVAALPLGAIVPRYSQPHWERAAAVARSRGQWFGELRLQTTQGEERVVDVRCAPHAESPDDLILVLTDQTESRKFQAAERQAWRRRSAERLAAAAAQELDMPDDRPAHERAREFEVLGRTAETVADGPGPGFDGLSVLLVTGRPLVRECLRLALESWGITVAVAADGFEAVEHLEKDRAGIRAALIDADLPGWGASGVLTSLRRKDTLMPAVLLGSAAGKRIADEVQAVVPKPYRIEDVLWAVRESQKGAVRS